MIVGTSPVLLIEGLLRARAGQRVVFVEAKSQIGGAWAMTEALGLTDVEAACHLMVNYRGGYEFLSDECGIDMEICEPQPQLFREQRLTDFNAKRHVLRRTSGLLVRFGIVGLVRIVESVLAGRWRLRKTREFDLAHAAQKLADQRLYPMLGSAVSRAIRYPVGGTPAMMKKLQSQLEGEGAQWVHDRALRVKLQPTGPVRVALASGGELLANTLVVSESADIERVESEHNARSFEARIGRHMAIVMRVSGAARPFLSYVELPFDPVVERATDVTAFCQGSIPQDSRILVCEIPESQLAESTLPRAEDVLEYLQKLELVPAEIRLVEHEPCVLELQRREKELVEHLKGLESAAVVVVPSRGDFCLSLHRNRRRWQELVKSPPTPSTFDRELAVGATS